MINIILLNVGYLILFMYFLHKIKHGFHIYQLEYYKPNRYRLWRKKNPKQVLKIRDLSLIITAIVMIFNVRIGAIIAIAFSIFLWFSRDIYPEKTKIKNTNRIKITYVIALLFIIACVACSNVGLALNNVIMLSIANGIYTLIIILLMYYVVFVNMLIQPYENHNNKKFYKMAEKKLASMPDLKIIGVTGSYGKTSVKYILTSILKQKYNTFMTPGNFNTLLGVQRSINEHLKSTDEIFVCEMGAKEVGKIKEICDLVKPKMGILTAVGPQHLETFGSLENIKKAKMELINSVPEDGLRVVNFENENAADAAKDTKCLKYGLNKNFDAYAYNIKMTDTGSSFDIHTKDLEIHDIKTKLIGKLNIINIVGAVAVAANLGLTEDEIKAGIRFLQPVPHRLELIKNPNGSIIIDDAYNSNIEGAANAFQTLKKFQDKIRIIVTPGLVDLGEESFTYNKEFGKKAAGCADYYILVGEEPAKAIFEGLVEAGEDKDKICVVDNINEAITKYGEFDAEKRVVLLENDLPDNYL